MPVKDDAVVSLTSSPLLHHLLGLYFVPRPTRPLAHSFMQDLSCRLSSACTHESMGVARFVKVIPSPGAFGQPSWHRFVVRGVIRVFMEKPEGLCGSLPEGRRREDRRGLLHRTDQLVQQHLHVRGGFSSPMACRKRSGSPGADIEKAHGEQRCPGPGDGRLLAGAVAIQPRGGSIE